MSTMSSIPNIPRLDPKPRRFYANIVYERIQAYISNAIGRAQPNEAIIVFVPLADGSRLQVEEFGFHNPNFIIVYGKDEKTNNSVEVLVSHTGIQVLLSVVKQQEQSPKPRIGFRDSVA